MNRGLWSLLFWILAVGLLYFFLSSIGAPAWLLWIAVALGIVGIFGAAVHLLGGGSPWGP